jgi:hypothetical protein
MCDLSVCINLYYIAHIFCCFLLLLPGFTRSYFGLFKMCQTLLTRSVQFSLTILALWVRFCIVTQENKLILPKFFWRLGFQWNGNHFFVYCQYSKCLFLLVISFHKHCKQSRFELKTTEAIQARFLDIWSRFCGWPIWQWLVDNWHMMWNNTASYTPSEYTSRAE